MTNEKTCAHERILTWYDEETGEPVGLWSCAGCHRKFAPMEPVGINGLTEAETSATASVMGVLGVPVVPAVDTKADAIEEIVVRAMGDAWGEFVDDTGCFPDDFKLEPRRRLSFIPGTWAYMVGQFVAQRLKRAYGVDLPGEGKK